MVPEVVIADGAEHVVVVVVVVVVGRSNVTVARTPEPTAIPWLINVTIICWPVPVKESGT